MSTSVMTASSDEPVATQIFAVERSKRQIDTVNRLMRGYADRGVFRGVSEGKFRRGRAEISVLWHYDLSYRCVVDTLTRSVTFPALLPQVTARSEMFVALKEFVRPFSTDEVPEHRYIDPAKAEVKLAVRNRSVSMGMQVRDGDYEYATRKLIHLVQETFMIFLKEGPYYDYRIAALGLNPDAEWC